MSTLEHSEARQKQRSTMLGHPACRFEGGPKRCSTANKLTLHAAAGGAAGSGGFAQAQSRRLVVEEMIRGIRAEGSIEAWQEGGLRAELESVMLADDGDPDLARLLSA